MKMKSLFYAVLISLFLMPAHLQLNAQEKRIVEPISMYRSIDDADPLRFFQPNVTGIIAGDLNGDGVTDFIKHQTSSADERTASPDDFLDKTMVYNLNADGQISATSFYYGALLYPVGDLNNDGRGDVAVINEMGISIHSFGSGELDISDIGVSFYETIFGVEVDQFVPEHDFDGDGVDDLFTGFSDFSGSIQCFIIFGSSNPDDIQSRSCDFGEELSGRTGRLNAGDVTGDSTSEPVIISAGAFPYKYQLDVLEISASKEISIDTTQILGDVNLSPSSTRSFIADVDGDQKDDILLSINRYQPAGLFQQVFFNPPVTYAAFSLGDEADSLFSPFQVFKNNVIVDHIFEAEDGSYSAFLMNNERGLLCETEAIDPMVSQFSESCTSVDTLNLEEDLVLFSSTYFPVINRGVDVESVPGKIARPERTRLSRFGIGHEPTRNPGLALIYTVTKSFGIQLIFTPATFTEQRTSGIESVRESQTSDGSKINEIMTLEIKPNIGINFFLSKNASLDLTFGFDFGSLNRLSNAVGEQFKDHVVQGVETLGSHVAIQTKSGSEDENNVATQTIMFRLGTSIWMGGGQKSNSVADTVYIDDFQIIDFSSFVDLNSLENIFIEANNIGDINNDGFDDVLFTSNSTGLKAGGSLNIAWGFYGGESFASLPDFTLDFKEDTTITDFGFPGLGTSVEGLGDINGDGLNDFGIGLPSYSYDDATGVVYVYFGTEEDNSEKISKAFEQPYPDLILQPTKIEGQSIFSFGAQFAGGDFNGDGFNDIAVLSDFSFGTPTPPAIQIFLGGMQMDSLADEFLYLTRSSLGGETDELIARTSGNNIQFLPKETGKDYQDILYIPGIFSGYPDAAIYDGGMESDSLPDIRLIGPNVNESFGFSDRGRMAVGDINDDGFYDIFMVKEIDSNDAFLSSRMYSYSPNSGILPISNEEIEIPGEYRLSQNYPNPFNPSTNIEFKLGSSSVVTLKIYDVLGREIATLIDNQRLNGGVHQATFNASSLASGIYLYRLEAGSFIQTRKMMLIK